MPSNDSSPSHEAQRPVSAQQFGQPKMEVSLVCRERGAHLHWNQKPIPDMPNQDDIGSDRVIVRSTFCNRGYRDLLLEKLSAMREMEAMCDIQLECEGSIIPAHKCVLSAGIPYFQSMFSTQMKENAMTLIPINDISHASLKAIVKFIYTNELVIDTMNVQGLLFAASVLQLDCISNECQLFLINNMTIDNCYELLPFAERHNCSTLMEGIFNFMSENFRIIQFCSGYLSLDVKELLCLLKRSDLNVKSEYEVISTAFIWIAAAEEERLYHLPEILRTIRFYQTTLPVLRKVLYHPWIQSNPKCKSIIFENFPLADGLTMRKEEPINLPHESNTEVCLTRELPPRRGAAGVIYCVGGRGSDTYPYNDGEAYDWRQNQWHTLPAMNTYRHHPGAVTVDRKLFVVGGHDGSDQCSSMECYDPQEGIWSSLSPMKRARRSIGLVALDRAIYAIGGLDQSSCFDMVERYDIERGMWSTIPPMIYRRGGISCTSIPELKIIFAAGGNEGHFALRTSEMFNPVVNRWSELPMMKRSRAGAGICYMDGYVYVIGGFNDDTAEDTCERFNLNTGIWEDMPNLPYPRGGVGAASMGGVVFAVGGNDGSKYLQSVDIYDPRTGQWNPAADLRYKRAGAGVARSE